MSLFFSARCLCGPRVRISDDFDSRRRRAPSARGRADPTGTMPLQRRWSADLDRRWRLVAKMLPDAIAQRTHPTNMIQHSVLTGQDPIRAFQGWLDEALRQVVLGGNGSWILPYVRGASDAGALHARSASQVRDAFDPEQPRDKDGKWTAGAEELFSDYNMGSLIKQSSGWQVVKAGDLAGGNEISKEDASLVNAAASHLQQLASSSTSRHKEVWRGIVMPEGTDVRALFHHNKVVAFDTLTATSGFRAVAEKYSDPQYLGEDRAEQVLLRIGRRGGIIGHDSTSGELAGAETILPAGSRYRVSQYSREGHLHVINLYDKGDLNKLRVIKDAAPPTDRTNLLQSLAITELQGIVEAVSQQLVRVFSDAAMTRTAPSVTAGLARGVIDRVGVRRGHMLVSFMCVRAFNAAALDGYRAQGVTRVGSIPEGRRRTRALDEDPDPSLVSKAYRAQGKLERALGEGGVDVLTAGDDDVCPECQDISDNGPYSLDEAEGLIPAHVECRCALIPADDERYADVTEDALDSSTHVAAGVMIVAEDTGRALFLKRSGTATDQPGVWAFPAGAVEPGETIEGAAARETKEETGYDVGDPGNLEQVHRQDASGVDFTTYAHTAEGEFVPMLNAEHDAHIWAYADKAPQPLHPGVASTLRELA